MKRKIFSLFTIVAFMVFSLSCYSTKIMRLDASAAKYEKKGNIISVKNTSGEVYEFSETQPGKLSKGRIEGVAIKVTRAIEIEKANIEKEEKDNDGNFLIIITKDKKVYREFSGTVTVEEDKYIFNGTFNIQRSISIPLSEVEHVQMMVKELKTVTTILAVVGTALIVLVVVAAVGWSSWGGRPIL